MAADTNNKSAAQSMYTYAGREWAASGVVGMHRLHSVLSLGVLIGLEALGAASAKAECLNWSDWEHVAGCQSNGWNSATASISNFAGETFSLEATLGGYNYCSPLGFSTSYFYQLSKNVCDSVANDVAFEYSVLMINATTGAIDVIHEAKQATTAQACSHYSYNTPDGWYASDILLRIGFDCY